MYHTQWPKACRAGFAAFVVLGFLGQLAESQGAPKKCAQVNEYCQNHWDCCSNSCLSFLYRCTAGSGIPPPHLKPDYPPILVQYPPSQAAGKAENTQRFGGSPSTPKEVVPPKKCVPYNEYCQNHWDCCSNSCMSYLYRCTRRPGELPPDQQSVTTSLNGTYHDLVEQVFGNQSFSTAGDSNTTSATPSVEVDQRFGEVASNAPSTSHSTMANVESSSTPALDEHATTTREEYETNTNAVDRTTPQRNNTIVSVAAPGATAPCRKIGELCYRNEECCTKLCPNYLSRCVT